MARVCATCGAPADDDAMFCTECGGRELRDTPAVGMGGGFAGGGAGLRCEGCGAPLDPDSAFCTECGRQVTAGAGFGTSTGLGGGSTAPMYPAGPRCECGAPLDPDSVFCTECGRKVTPAGGGGPVNPVGPFVDPAPKQPDGPSRVRESQPVDDSEMKEFFHEAEGL